MCQINYTTEKRKNKALDEFELSKIDILFFANFKNYIDKEKKRSIILI